MTDETPTPLPSGLVDVTDQHQGVAFQFVGLALTAPAPPPGPPPPGAPLSVDPVEEAL